MKSASPMKPTMSSRIKIPSIVGNVSRWSACHFVRKSRNDPQETLNGLGIGLQGHQELVVPIRNVATLKGPRDTEKRILWPRSSIRGRAQRSRLSMKGSRPSEAGRARGGLRSVSRP